MYYKKEICELLKAQGLSFEYYEHPPLVTMADEEQAMLPYFEELAKNVFASDDKRRDYFLISVRGNGRIDLKAIGAPWGYRHLRMASEQELSEKLGVISGAVSPLSLLNGDARSIRFFIDSRFEEGFIRLHPNDNTATICMNAADLLRLLSEQGCEIHRF
ncbi:MAG: prolyl-tRNA synthetase associated domain-containing protein [Firmicutes bacterium]|nr:prolyl-tRNA synthetase associated domain-containing protein [Bacillota bacterium]